MFQMLHMLLWMHYFLCEMHCSWLYKEGKRAVAIATIAKFNNNIGLLDMLFFLVGTTIYSHFIFGLHSFCNWIWDPS